MRLQLARARRLAEVPGDCTGPGARLEDSMAFVNFGHVDQRSRQPFWRLEKLILLLGVSDFPSRHGIRDGVPRVSVKQMAPQASTPLSSEQFENVIYLFM